MSSFGYAGTIAHARKPNDHAILAQKKRPGRASGRVGMGEAYSNGVESRRSALIDRRSRPVPISSANSGRLTANLCAAEAHGRIAIVTADLGAVHQYQQISQRDRFDGPMFPCTPHQFGHSTSFRVARMTDDEETCIAWFREYHAALVGEIEELFVAADSSPPTAALLAELTT